MNLKHMKNTVMYNSLFLQMQYRSFINSTNIYSVPSRSCPQHSVPSDSPGRGGEAGETWESLNEGMTESVLRFSRIPATVLRTDHQG